MSNSKVTHIDSRRKPRAVVPQEPQIKKSSSRQEFIRVAEIGIDLLDPREGEVRTFEFEVPIPANATEEKYLKGFEHRIKGGHLREAGHFQKSFRRGFRAAGDLIAEQRSKQGTPAMPMRAKFSITPTW